jgi:hypothetical protein
MSDVAIWVERFSTGYCIGPRERYKALRDVITDAFTSPFRRLWGNSQFDLRNSQCLSGCLLPTAFWSFTFRNRRRNGEVMGDVASFVALRCPIAGGQAIHLISWGMRTDHRWDAARRRAYEGTRVRKYQNAREGGSPTPFGWRIGGDADARPGRLTPSHLQSGAREAAPCPPAVGVEVRLRIATVCGRSEESAILPPTAQSSITGRRRRQDACQPA